MSRRRGGGGGGHSGGDERWLLTYADMITLLLALFIVLFAMSSLDSKKFDNLRRSLSQTFKGQIVEEQGMLAPGSTGVLDPNAANRDSNTVFDPQSEASDVTAKAFNAEREDLEKLAESAALKGKVNVESTQRGIVVSLAGDEFFATGSSVLKPEARQSLKAVAQEIKAFGREIDIEGHTDGQGDPRSNQHLSHDRSESVYDLFFELGVDPMKMQASGFGEAKPKVRPPNPEASVAENRRIEIVILAPVPSASDSASSKSDEAAPKREPGKRGGAQQPRDLVDLRADEAPDLAPDPIDITDDVTAVSQQ